MFLQIRDDENKSIVMSLSDLFLNAILKISLILVYLVFLISQRSVLLDDNL